MTVADEAGTPIRQPEILHGCEEALGLHLDRLSEQAAGPDPQHLGQGIVDRVRLTEPDDGGRAFHGVSLSLRGSGRLGHPPRYAAFTPPSSPNLPHSSSPTWARYRAKPKASCTSSGKSW